MEKQQIELKNAKSNDYAFEESVKTLRTNIRYCGRNIRVVMLTSSMPNEGKSSVTFALARALAQTGQKTLLIDADIRKSVLVSRYQLEQDVSGLSQYLSGQNSLEEVIYGTNIENLDMLFSGPFSPNPAELLEETSFTSLIKWAKETYDYVIIDTPPITNVIDAAIIAKECDGAAMVVESGAISYRVAQRVKQQLEKSGCRILGVILNKVGNEHSGYYSKYYGKYGRYGKYSRYGQYGQYGGEYDGVVTKHGKKG